MNRTCIIITAILATACGTARRAQNSEASRVEVRTETVIRHDTAWVELPVIIEKRTTLDTASTLENKYAKSEATVANGVLTHFLSTKPVREPVTVETKTVYKDSLVYVDRIRTETIEVEKPLNWWQQLKLKVGSLFLILTLIAIGYPIIIHFVLPKS